MQESKPCHRALDEGLCVPWWSSWSSWSHCTATCGFVERTRYRACIGAWSKAKADARMKKILDDSCASVFRAPDAKETLDCPMKRLCPNVNGAWGPWLPFTSCSVTCGTGIRTRTRMCNHPRPQGNGLYCQGIDTHKVRMQLL